MAEDKQQTTNLLGKRKRPVDGVVGSSGGTRVRVFPLEEQESLLKEVSLFVLEVTCVYILEELCFYILEEAGLSGPEEPREGGARAMEPRKGPPPPSQAGGEKRRLEEVARAVQSDWDQREFAESIKLNIRRVFDFIVNFEAAALSRIAVLNSRIASLEHTLASLEEQLEPAANFVEQQRQQQTEPEQGLQQEPRRGGRDNQVS